MLDAALSALGTLLTPYHMGMLIFGVMVGLLIGILPGLGGIVGMSILLPFVPHLEAQAAFAMLIGMVAVIPTSDTFPSVLMGIPGSSGSQATILDGFPLAKRGEAARAFGAAFSASLVGGLFGALVLTLILPIARPIVLAFASPELFMLALLGLSMVGVLSGRHVLKGLVAAGLGLMMGTIGAAPAVTVYRYTLDIPYLTDGIPLVVVGLGLFALPEIIDLLIKGTAISDVPGLGRGWWDGVHDTIRHKWIVLRCSAIGVIVGFLPGLGGTVVDWISYGHVIQTTPKGDRNGFGKGDIRGVIAPESSNNAKESGGLIPTLLFGIPGSGSMAIFLGGIFLLGIEPGPGMMKDNLDLVYTAIWSLAFANIFGTGICLVLSRPITRLTFIPFKTLAPFLIMIIVLAAYQGTRDWGDFLALLVTGIMGWLMKRFGWPRPAALIGYVLSDTTESYLFISVQRYGADWLLRPGVLILGLIIALSVGTGVFWQAQRRHSGEKTESLEK
jgi:TctA family transporter